MNPVDRISMIRVTGEAWRNNDAYVRDAVRRMDPRGGDIIIIVAHRSRAEALERNLRAQLVPQGLAE